MATSTTSQTQRLSRTHSVALHKFPALEKEKAIRKLTAEGFSIVNVPAASSREKVIVVSYDGSFKHASTSNRPVVNSNWLDSPDTNAREQLTKYTFALKGIKFLVFGKVTEKKQSQAEMDLW